MNELYLAFDFGFRRIGIAVGQVLTKTATPIETVLANNGIPQWSEISALIKKWHPCGLIVGLPLALNGSELYVTKGAQEFAKSLGEHTKLPVYMVDERLSTKAARSELFEQGGSRKIKKSCVDSVAACIILEQWLQTGGK